MKRSNIIFGLLVALLLVVVFRQWFAPSLLAGGDVGYFSSATLQKLDPRVFVWDTRQGLGLGGVLAPFLWIFVMSTVYMFIAKSVIGPHWLIIERLIYLYPFLIIGVISTYYLARKFIHSKLFFFFSFIIYFFNTYILMILGGGQVLIGLAYALAPSVLMLFIFLIEGKERVSYQTFLSSILAGVIFALQVLCDVRIAYVTFLAVSLYFLFDLLVSGRLDVKSLGKKVIFVFILPIVIAVMLHAFWILPTKMIGGNPVQELGTAYSTTSAVQYFSFAKFENSISLLHPNWPENIFGKVGFMKPEFLLLPILAFASLLFINRRQKVENNKQKYILYFALLGLLGAFLAKGANDPFGGIYLWMFNHVPGFMLFRDPSKWYTLVAISYAVLIPFSVSKIYEWLKSFRKFLIFNFQFPIKNKIFNLQNCFLFVVFCSLLFLIHPALLGQLTGTFKPTTVPSEYQRLEQFLSTQKQFSRILWVPTTQRFGYSSSLHPAIPARDYFNAYDNKKLLEILSQKGIQQFLQEAGVKYIIVPYDSQKEIFLKDRKYDDLSHQYVLQQVAALPGIKKVQGFGQIGVFELSSPKTHFWSPNSVTVSSVLINPTKYQVHVQNAKKGDTLVFAESFDPRWEATLISSSKYQVTSVKYDNMFNSFVLPEDGSFTFDVSYTPQKWVNIGLLISLLTTVSLLVLGGYFYVKNKTASS